MTFYWSNLAFFLAESVRKYFRVLIVSIGDQVSPITPLFFMPPFTTIIHFNLSRFP